MAEKQAPSQNVSVKTHSRPDWDTYFLDIVELVSKRATCLRRAVGAGLVRDRRILATGYNGAPSKLQHCLDIGCLREQLNVPSGERHELCRGLHAEQNAIIQAALHGVSTKDSTLYCTNHPCVIDHQDEMKAVVSFKIQVVLVYIMNRQFFSGSRFPCILN